MQGAERPRESGLSRPTDIEGATVTVPHPLAPRPTIYRGIPMRSRLEARVAAALDDRGLEWRYEPRAYAGQAGQYLPDFEVLGQEHPTFIEVKPPIMDRIEDALERMPIILESIPDAKLILIVDGADFDLVRVGSGRWTRVGTAA